MQVLELARIEIFDIFDRACKFSRVLKRLRTYAIQTRVLASSIISLI